MIISRISRNKLITLLSVLTIPFISYVFIFVEIVNKKKYSLYCLAFVMAVFSIYILPVADLFRHTLLYYELKDYEPSWFLDYLKTRPDFVFYIIVYLFGRIGINFEMVRFLSVFVGYLVYFEIFWDYLKRGFFEKKKDYLYVFIAFFLYVPFFDLGGGIRFYFSTAILSGAFYKIYVLRDLRQGILWGVLSCLIHFGQIPLFLLLLMLRNIILMRFKYLFLSLSIALILSGNLLVPLIVEVLPISDVYKMILVSYTDVSMLQETSEDSIMTLLYIYMVKFPLLISVLYLFKSNVKNEMMNLAVGVLLLLSLLYSFPIGGRYMMFFVFVIFIVYLELDLKNNTNKWYMKLFLLNFGLIFFMRFYYWRMLLPNSRIKEFFFTPTMLSLFHSDDPNEIFLNVDEEGTLLKPF